MSIDYDDMKVREGVHDGYWDVKRGDRWAFEGAYCLSCLEAFVKLREGT